MARLLREIRCIDSAFANRVLSGPELATQLAVNPNYLNPVNGHDFEGRPCSIGTEVRTRIVSSASFARAEGRAQPGVSTTRPTPPPVVVAVPADPVVVPVTQQMPILISDQSAPASFPARTPLAAAANAFVAFRDLFPAIFALEIQEGP